MTTCTLCRLPADPSTIGTISPLCHCCLRDLGRSPVAARPVSTFPPMARANCAAARLSLTRATRRLSGIRRGADLVETVRPGVRA